MQHALLSTDLLFLALLHASHNELIQYYLNSCATRTTMATWGSVQCRIISQLIYSYQDDLPIFLWKFWQQQFTATINFFHSLFHKFA